MLFGGRQEIPESINSSGFTFSEQAHSHVGEIGANASRNFLCPQILSCPEKFLLNHIVKTKYCYP